MSYDVELKDKNGNLVRVDRHAEGGTYMIGGSTEGHLNITYNYSWFYHHFLDEEKGLRWLNNRMGKQCIYRLKIAVEALGTKRYSRSRDGKNSSLENYVNDYWAPTPGNAGYALSILLKWAEQYPDAVFEVD